jgi:hypothetical protein
VVADFAARLSETAPIWYRQVAPVAEWVARAFWSTIRRPDTPFTTRLTQNNKRAAKGSPPQSQLVRVPFQQNYVWLAERRLTALTLGRRRATP